MREKLIELLEADPCVCEGWDCINNCKYANLKNCFGERYADHLIANGVTFATDNNVGDKVSTTDKDINVHSKWIPVTERLPQEDEPESTTCEQVQVLLDNGVVSTGWCNRYFKMWWHLNYGETHFVGYDYERTPVVAWQPLAEPPKGE